MGQIKTERLCLSERPVMLERMRAFTSLALNFVLTLVEILAVSFTAGGVSLRAKETVNYDDPNLVFTSNYVGDTVANCPKSLKGNDLSACLVRNGLAAGETAKTTQADDDSDHSIR